MFRAEKLSNETGPFLLFFGMLSYTLDSGGDSLIIRAPLKSYCPESFRDWVVLEILTYCMYAPVSALHPPRSQIAHDSF